MKRLYALLMSCALVFSGSYITALAENETESQTEEPEEVIEEVAEAAEEDVTAEEAVTEEAPAAEAASEEAPAEEAAPEEAAVIEEEPEETGETLAAEKGIVSGKVVNKDGSEISLEEPVTAVLCRMDWKDETKTNADMVEVAKCVIPAGSGAFEFKDVEDADYRVTGNAVIGNSLFKIAMATNFITVKDGVATVKDGAPLTDFTVSSSWVYSYNNGTDVYTTFDKKKDEAFELSYETPGSFSQIYLFPIDHDTYKGGMITEGFTIDTEKHVIRFDKEFIEKLVSGTKYGVTITTAEGVEYLHFSVDDAMDCVFVNEGEKSYWYENGVRQGTVNDTNGVVGDGTVRGREIYDPVTNEWYWLDAVYDGAKAVGKEVWMPYVYQNEDSWTAEEKAKLASESDEGMADLVLTEMNEKHGKWVRYDENGAMLKGWVTITGDLAEHYPEQAGKTYYYDTRTGIMARGTITLGGKTYQFDDITGELLSN